MNKKTILMVLTIFIFVNAKSQTSSSNPELKKYFDAHLSWGDKFTSRLFGQLKECNLNVYFMYGEEDAPTDKFVIQIGGHDNDGKPIPIFNTKIVSFTNNILTLKISSNISSNIDQVEKCFLNNQFKIGQTFKLKMNNELQIISLNGKPILLDSGLD
jgi:hypothetical protein